MISALPSVPLSVGAHRVVKGVRVEHLCGDPSLSKEQDRELMLRIVRTALAAVQTSVEQPTLFDPAQTAPEKVHAA
jgi:glycine reductase complex component B subunit gamma